LTMMASRAFYARSAAAAAVAGGFSDRD
jgi:hypothetical protein